MARLNGKLKKWLKSKTLPRLHKGYNRFIKYTITNLPDESPQYTGFYASSWKASTDIPRAFETYQKLKDSSALEPWYALGLVLRSEGKGARPPIVRPRYNIPEFQLEDTVYIANTAIYSKYALAQKPPATTKFGGIIPFVKILPMKISESFKDDLNINILSRPS